MAPATWRVTQMTGLFPMRRKELLSHWENVSQSPRQNLRPDMFDPSSRARHCQNVAIVSLLALIALGLAWETFLAPLRPGGSWLMLKVLPLLLPLWGILHGRRYTFQWACMLILFYFSEGVVRAWSDRAPSSTLALMEIALSAAFFFAAVFYAKFTANPGEERKRVI